MWELGHKEDWVLIGSLLPSFTWQKPLQYCKVISLQLIKINGKKRERERELSAEYWCFRNMGLEKTLESPLNSKEVAPVNPKGNQPWIFIGRTDTEAETPILWPPDAKSQLTGRDPDAWKDWGQEKKGITENEAVGWHYWLKEHESEQTLEDSKNREAWHAAVHGVAKSWTELRNWKQQKELNDIGVKQQLQYSCLENKRGEIVWLSHFMFEFLPWSRFT